MPYTKWWLEQDPFHYLGENTHGILLSATLLVRTRRTTDGRSHQTERTGIALGTRVQRQDPGTSRAGRRLCRRKHHTLHEFRRGGDGLWRREAPEKCHRRCF
jgi:hypothetical protein